MDDLFAQNQRISKLTRLGDPLDSLVDFAALAALVDAKAPRTDPKLGGRPAYEWTGTGEGAADVQCDGVRL